MMKISTEWHEVLEEEFCKPYVQTLKSFLLEEKSRGREIFPQEPDVFSAFKTTPFSRVRVVLLGQDPYHGEGQAHGLCFSVREGTPPPPSLKNIFKEIERDVGVKIPKNKGDLTPWANQGVFLLNTTLTVRKGDPGSHFGKGWEIFTDAVIEKILKKKEPIIFLLWGKAAQEKLPKITQFSAMKHLVLKAPHPSPFSAHTGFLGCSHFSQTNKALEGLGKAPIDWNI